ncbi:MAG: hypothetical protein SFY56_08760 [Bacteroidota bacterium]|nr:hypothetical protein [Bacteroidota bacterium]
MKKNTLILLLAYNIASAQSIVEIEKELLYNFTQLNRFTIEGENISDSLAFYNKQLSEKILKYASSSKEMLNYTFPNIGAQYWTIATSPDSKFRIYSWDTQASGSMRFYNNIFQWKDYDTLYAKKNEIEEGMPGGFYSQIFQLTDELNTFYMCYFNSVLSNRDCYQAIHCMDFERKVFNKEFKKIKTKSGTNFKLGFSFDWNSVKYLKEYPYKLIKFNSTTNTIVIPVVNTEGKVSSKSIFYKYDGDYFVKETVKK